MDLSSAKPRTLSHYEALVLAGMRTIAGSLDIALDLEELAAPARMAPLHFHRVFRGLVGETPLQLHRRLRLERAAHRLADGSDSVLRVALDAGYETHEAFTRAFRAAFGVSPTEHRALAESDRATAPAACAAGARRPTCQLPAACGLHADGAVVHFPLQVTQLFIRQGDRIMDVQLELRPEIRVATLAHSGPYNTIGSTFERLGALAGPAGLFASPGTRMIAIYYDDPETTPTESLRSAAGLTVDPNVKLPPSLREVRLPSGRWARMLHRGSYAGLGDAWQRLLGQWLPASGLRLGPGECYELYVNDPGSAREEDLETLLYIPIDG